MMMFFRSTPMLPLPSLPTKFGGEGDALFVMFEEAGLSHGIIKVC